MESSPNHRKIPQTSAPPEEITNPLPLLPRLPPNWVSPNTNSAQALFQGRYFTLLEVRTCSSA